MTNEAIIMEQSLLLVEQGVLKAFDMNGELIPEPIHTFNGWKSRGYKVKKGEKSNIKFPIWKFTKKEIKKEDKEIEEKTSMFLKNSAFFTMAQVEKA